MTHSGKLCAVSTALLVITVSGCAGNGLRNMFSRNETDGYKTLEEIEAEEAKSAERDSAVDDADSGGTRFASWLPFGKKSDEESEAIAASDAASADAETERAGWWHNPFRRSESVETDPFLTQDESQNTAIAKNEKPALRKKTLLETAREKESSPKRNPDSSIRSVSDTRETKALPAENEMLVDKFEKHFQKNTVETAEAAEHAEPLIVAGKLAGDDSKKPGTAEEEKLAELERLLAQARPSAKNQKPPGRSPAKVSPDLTEVSDDMLEASKGLASAEHHPAGVARKQVSRAADSFDSFLSDTPHRSAAARQAQMSGNGNRTNRAATLGSTDVEVAGADWLFGRPTSGSAVNDATADSGDAASGGWSGKVAENAFQWTQSQIGDAAKAPARAGQVLQSAADRLSSEFAAARPGNLPLARIPDTPDPGFRLPADSVVHSAGRKTRSEANAIQNASARRDLSSTATSGGLTKDPFFAESAVDSAVLPVNSETTEQQPSTASRGGLASMQSRHWLLLVGGIIVVVLLFAPARKKPIQANHAPVQG